MGRGTITGTYILPNGVGRQSSVRIIPSVLTVDGDEERLVDGTIDTYLIQGTFTQVVEDSETGDPLGVTYTVEVDGFPTVSGIWVPTDGVVQMGKVTPLDPQAPSYAQQVSLADLRAVLDRLAELEEIVANLGTGPAPTPGPVEDPTTPGLYSTTGTTETTPGLYAPTGLVEDPTAPSLYLLGA